MEADHLKLIEMTVQFLQFMTSIFAIVLSAIGASFYYYWTTRSSNIPVRDLAAFAWPAGMALFAFLTMGYIYALQIDSLSAGFITDYRFFWINWSALILGLILCANIVILVCAFIRVHRNVTRSAE